MTTYVFTQKNDSGTATITAESEDNAMEWLQSNMTNPYDWRLDETEEDEVW